MSQAVVKRMSCSYIRCGWLHYLLLIAVCLVPGSSLVNATKAQRVTVAVAANALAPLRQIAQKFERDTGVSVRLVPGATGSLYTQIRQGAPYDLFLAADTHSPERLESEGWLVPGSRFVYARGQLVLWSRDVSLVDGTDNVLRRDEGLRLAIAQPLHAPYGVAAVAVLQSLGLYEDWQRRLVYGESVGKTWQFVASGNADLGFVAASQLHDSPGGSHWLVPVDLQPPLPQGTGLLRHAENKLSAWDFLHYLCSADAKGIFRNFGYLPGDCGVTD